MKLFFDGGFRPTTKKAAFGWVLLDKHDDVVHKRAKMLPPKTTINEAEYSGLIDGLKYLNENRIDDVKIFGDSLLVVNQLKGSYRVKAKNLEKYHKKAKELIGKRQITWIKRTENELADTECDRVLDATED